MASVSDDLPRVAALPTHDLRVEWRRHHRSDPPASLSRDMLFRAVAYTLQERAHGRLSQSARRALHALCVTGSAADAGPGTGPILKPGGRLVREWHGEAHSVLVLEDGFEYRDQRYRSLTQIAEAITGVHWSGPRFFAAAPARRSRTVPPATVPHAIATAGAHGPA